MKLHATVLGVLLISATLVQLSLRGHPCFPRSEIVLILQGRYDESLQGLGYNSEGNLVEFWMRKEGEGYGPTWTLLVTLPDGNSCIVQKGTTWSVIPHVYPKKGASR